jgi:hypothetical protein
VLILTGILHKATVENTPAMVSNTDKTEIPDEIITNKIYVIRDIKVMLDEDLAELYNVTTGNLNKAVKRNAARFPEDFIFQLSKKEFSDLLFQIGRASWGGRRTPPIAFTEQGVAMLSGVLHSERAIKVNIQIMRVFTRMREMLETHKEILKKLDNLERKDIEQDKKIILIFEYLKKLELAKQKELRQQNPKRVGFKRKDEN